MPETLWFESNRDGLLFQLLIILRFSSAGDTFPIGSSRLSRPRKSERPNNCVRRIIAPSFAQPFIRGIEHVIGGGLYEQRHVVRYVRCISTFLHCKV